MAWMLSYRLGEAAAVVRPERVADTISGWASWDISWKFVTSALGWRVSASGYG